MQGMRRESNLRPHTILAGGLRLDGVASGYWTPSAKRSSGYQPLGFDSLALRGHSMFANILDNAAARVILKMFRGRVQYQNYGPG